jgi:hypothetical protein
MGCDSSVRPFFTRPKSCDASSYGRLLNTDALNFNSVPVDGFVASIDGG